MEILAAYDLTGSLRDAAELAGCSHHTVGRYVAAREEGRVPGDAPARRAGVIDPFLAKLEELVDRSRGKVRADVAHEKITAMGYGGSERTTRRAVARMKASYAAGRRRVFRPWVPEPGMWAQYDFGDGPRIGGTPTILFCLWLAWSRFRVVLPLLDKSQPSVFAAVDVALRLAGGCPTYLLTGNEKTVTVEHVAGMPVRNPAAVTFARHYGLTIATCVPADPASKGGSESSVRVAKADLVPTAANLLAEYASFAELEAACAVFGDQVNARPHRVTRRAPAEMLAEERGRLHPVPAVPFTAALGVTRKVDDLSMVSFEGARYSVPHQLAGQAVWVRRHGEQAVIVHAGADGPAEVARHQLAAPAVPASRKATTRRPRQGRWAAGPGHGRLPRRSSWRSGTARGCGWPRPPRPGPAGSGPRWPAPRSSPGCTRPPTWTGRWGRLLRPGGSARVTSPRSSPTRRRRPPVPPPGPARPTRWLRAPPAGQGSAAAR